jgi:peptidyl-prolyl cis-trans isomerase A (cyclophilin A)
MSAFVPARRLALVPALAGLLVLAACGGGGDGGGTPVTPVNPTPPAPATACSAAGVAASNASTATVTVCMLTTQGEIVVALDPVKAPVTVENFLRYVASGHYTNTLYHRVVKDFVVQGGGFAAVLSEGYTASPVEKATFPPIVLESNNGLSNVRGTIAMARRDAPNSATSQFYINTVNNTGLDYVAGVSGREGYAVFGTVIHGLENVDKINAVSTSSANVNFPNRPRQDVVTYWAQKLKG